MVRRTSKLGYAGDPKFLEVPAAELISAVAGELHRLFFNSLSALETSSVLLTEVSLAKHVPVPTEGQIPHARTVPAPARGANSCLEPQTGIKCPHRPFTAVTR